MVMTTFMIFDWAGRQIPKYEWAHKRLTVKSCFVISICRCIFYALFLMEALPAYSCDENNKNCTGGPLIKSDVVTILTMLIFALSNGWISSVTMMKYQSQVSPSDCPLASTIMTFMLNTGLFIGSLGGLAISAAF